MYKQRCKRAYLVRADFSIRWSNDLSCTGRYNKLALDVIATDGTCMKLVDEIHTFVQTASHPIGNLLVKGVAMGTSHTAAVTGNTLSIDLIYDNYNYY